MHRRTAGIVLIGAGLVLGLLSALANPLGIGAHGFGWKQIVGVIVGATALLAGAWVAGRNSRGSRAL